METPREGQRESTVSFQRVLVIEDEREMARLVGQSLEMEGFRVTTCHEIDVARRLWCSQDPGVVLLDIMLPDGNGLDLLKEMRENGDTTPVIVVSALGSIVDRVYALDLGADDYLSKPFSMEELAARIRARIRRDKAPTQPIRCGDLQIDLFSRRASRAGRQLYLSNTEFGLLEMLAKKNGKPVDREDIMEALWDDSKRSTNILEVYVHYLRVKTERGGQSRLIHTVKGQGYALEDRG